MTTYDAATMDILRSTLRTNPGMKEQLRMQFPGAIELLEVQTPPAPPPPPVDIQQLVKEEVARQLATKPAQPETPKVDEGALKAAAFTLMKESLTPEQMEWVISHVMKGAPGFGNFLTSSEIKTVVQLGFEQYKIFLEK